MVAPRCPAARCAPRRVPGRHGRDFVRRHRQPHRWFLLATALRAALVAELASLARASCAGFGLRLGSTPSHSVRRRCRLRRAPDSALGRAVVSTQVRTPPSALPPPCSARPRAAPPALPPAQTPRRLRTAGVTPADLPNVDAAGLAVPDRPGRPWVSHPTHLWCRTHKTAHAASLGVTTLILHSSARPWRAGKSDTNLVPHPASTLSH